jgi:hypothetical protein
LAKFVRACLHHYDLPLIASLLTEANRIMIECAPLKAVPA